MTPPLFLLTSDGTPQPHVSFRHAKQLTALAQDLGNLKVIPSDKAPRTLVTMNSRVRVRTVGENESEVFTLVYPENADIMVGRISALSPMGRALLGRRAGETVEVDAPTGARQVKIEKLIYQPETAGHYEL